MDGCEEWGKGINYKLNCLANGGEASKWPMMTNRAEGEKWTERRKRVLLCDEAKRHTERSGAQKPMKKKEIGWVDSRMGPGEKGYFWDYGKEGEREEGDAAENGHEKGNKKRWGKWSMEG